jgi:predicted dehydrogenase
MAAGVIDRRFLICGLGSIGRRHLQNLMDLGERDIAFFRSGVATLPGEDLPELPTYSDLQEAFDEWEPTVLLVTNPTSMHLEVAIPAAERGIHLFVEKPISHALEGVDILQTHVAESGSEVLVGYQFRLHPGLRRLRQLLGSGELGEPVTATAYWGEYLPGWHPWEDHRCSYSARPELGGGVILTLSHPLDYLRWILGEVREVSARSLVEGPLGLEVDEVAEISLQHASGAHSHAHLDYVRRPARHDLEVVCTEGVLRWDGIRHDLRWRHAGDDSWEEFTPGANFDRSSLFLDEMIHFLTILEGESAPVCSLDDGVAALRICLAALESSSTGKTISIPVAEGV